MTKKQIKQLARIGLGAVVYVVAIVLPFEGLLRLPAFLAAYIILGGNVLLRAGRNILRGQIFDENFLMAVATIGALALGEYSEAVAVMLFYQVGEWFEGYAVGKSRRSITSLMDIRPDHANLQNEDGTIAEVAPEDVPVGAVIIVKPGERVPLDGVVQEGETSLDTSALTGESAPRDILAGDEVISGCINLNGVVKVQVTKAYGESTVSRILDLVENSSTKKAKAENFITRFARVYTPAVCGAALLLAVVPPLLLGQPFEDWVYRALTFLVISCPCALVISIPLSFFGGIGGASKTGVLIKGSNYLEALARTETVVFDKTGTLTKGTFIVGNIIANEISEEKLLELAAYAEIYSDHPIARSIKKEYGKTLNPDRIKEVQEVAGHGICAVVDGQKVCAGNRRLMQNAGIELEVDDPAGTVIHLTLNDIYAGCIVVEDEIKPDAQNAIRLLKKAGVHKTVMLTGDSDAVGRKVAASLGIDEVHTQLLPGDKVNIVEEMLGHNAAAGSKGRLVFVGDGINDAPVLARADIGIAMGGLGSEAAIEAADVVLMTDEPSRIAGAIQISRRTLSIVHQNIIFALGVKALVLLLTAFGYTSMWAGIFADVGVSMLAILNAMRALQVQGVERHVNVANLQEDKLLGQGIQCSTCSTCAEDKCETKNSRQHDE